MGDVLRGADYGLLGGEGVLLALLFSKEWKLSARECGVFLVCLLWKRSCSMRIRHERLPVRADV